MEERCSSSAVERFSNAPKSTGSESSCSSGRRRRSRALIRELLLGGVVGKVGRRGLGDELELGSAESLIANDGIRPVGL